ncbi:MAG: KTSC domain-containing protein [Acidimicrobiales bacterium]
MSWTLTPRSQTFVGYGYVKRGGHLTLTFRKGDQDTCRYHGVPLAVYEAFLRAPSKGSFYNKRIKDKYLADLIG